MFDVSKTNIIIMDKYFVYVFSEKCKTLFVVDNFKFNQNHISKSNVITWRYTKYRANLYTEEGKAEYCDLKTKHY